MNAPHFFAIPTPITFVYIYYYLLNFRFQYIKVQARQICYDLCERKLERDVRIGK